MQIRVSRSALFRGQHFGDEAIVLCSRWYLRYPLSYRNLEEMMAERSLKLDHSAIARWGPAICTSAEQADSIGTGRGG